MREAPALVRRLLELLLLPDVFEVRVVEARRERVEPVVRRPAELRRLEFQFAIIVVSLLLGRVPPNGGGKNAFIFALSALNASPLTYHSK